MQVLNTEKLGSHEKPSLMVDDLQVSLPYTVANGELYLHIDHIEYCMGSLKLQVMAREIRHFCVKNVYNNECSALPNSKIITLILVL